MVAKWKVVVEGGEHVFDSPGEAAAFALRALERGARQLTVERVLSWREKLAWGLRRLACKPLKLRVLEYKLQYRKRQPPLTLPL